MSGPKLMGITCDEEIIRRNRERLQLIGKYEYFKGSIDGINTDIENTIMWIQNYGQEIILDNSNSWFKNVDTVSKIDLLKRDFISKLKSKKLDYSIIDQFSVSELNNIICDLIELLPHEKEKFIEAISEFVDKIQNSNELQTNVSRQELLKKRDAEISSGRVQLKDLNQFEELSNIEMVSLSSIHSCKEKRDFSIAEMLFIDNVKKEINQIKDQSDDYSGVEYLLDKIEIILRYIENSSEYEGKKKALNNIKMYYQALNKELARQRTFSTANYIRRKKLHEYQMLANALNIKMCSPDISDEDLEIALEALTEEALEQEERIYIEDTVEEIMKSYGYSSIASTNLHEYERTSNIIFEDTEDKKLSVSFGDNMLMVQVVGEGDSEPSEAETNDQLTQQVALCKIYPELKQELEKRNIHINMENCAPVSKDSCKNVKINRQTNNERNSTRHSLIKRTFGSDTYKNLHNAEANRPKYEYIDNN